MEEHTGQYLSYSLSLLPMSGRSVGIVRLRTKGHGVVVCLFTPYEGT
jgi:hypothetical protein